MDSNELWSLFTLAPPAAGVDFCSIQLIAKNPRVSQAAHERAMDRLLPLPSFIEQHECACVNGRPMVCATETAPSAGNAMPSKPAMMA
jgi:hypothetical protein